MGRITSESASEAHSLPSLRAIRRASSTDVAALCSLINEAYRVEAHFVHGPRTTEEAVQTMVARGEFLVLDGPGAQLLGAAHLRCAANRAHLGLLSVRPELQGLGLGRRLVAVAEMLAAAQGALSMQLQIVNLREELHSFYGKMGYRPTGTSAFDGSKTTLKDVHFIDMSKAL